VSTSGRQGPGDASGRSRLASAGVFDGLFAGVAFALLFVGLKLAGNGAGLWPVVAGQASALVLLAAVLVGTLRKLEDRSLRSRDVAGAAAVGALGAFGAVLYFVSTQAGLLSIVAVLTSLYPAATVLLAAGLLHEAVSRRQAIGLLLAASSIVLIVAG
jgi:drug/metabolite transporter (DMT)-like permease